MKRFLLASAAITLLVFVSALLIVFAFGARVQRIQPYEKEMQEMTGELGAEEGAPIDAIVVDRTGVVAEKNGVLYIDAAKHYPLQRVTLIWMAGGVWAGAIGIAGVSTIVKARRGASGGTGSVS